MLSDTQLSQLIDLCFAGAVLIDTSRREDPQLIDFTLPSEDGKRVLTTPTEWWRQPTLQPFTSYLHTAGEINAGAANDGRSFVVTTVDQSFIIETPEVDDNVSLHRIRRATLVDWMRYRPALLQLDRILRDSGTTYRFDAWLAEMDMAPATTVFAPRASRKVGLVTARDLESGRVVDTLAVEEDGGAYLATGTCGHLGTCADQWPAMARRGADPGAFVQGIANLGAWYSVAFTDPRAIITNKRLNELACDIPAAARPV
jgi:hypothetical protein